MNGKASGCPSISSAATRSIGSNRPSGSPSKQEWRLVDPVVSGIRVTAVVPAISGVSRQDVGLGERGLEIAPRHQLRRHQVQQVSRVDAHNALAGELLPPAFRLPVPHHQVAVAQVARHSEVQRRIAHPPVEGHGRVAQRAERHRYRKRRPGCRWLSRATSVWPVGKHAPGRSLPAPPPAARPPAQRSASAMLWNLGSSSGGMPSRPTPPDRNSS